MFVLKQQLVLFPTARVATCCIGLTRHSFKFQYATVYQHLQTFFIIFMLFSCLQMLYFSTFITTVDECGSESVNPRIMTPGQNDPASWKNRISWRWRGCRSGFFLTIPKNSSARHLDIRHVTVVKRCTDIFQDGGQHGHPEIKKCANSHAFSNNRFAVANRLEFTYRYLF